MNLSIEQIIGFLSGISIWTLVKILFCFAFFIYLVFTFVVLRQVSLMTQALYGQLESFLKFVSWALFLVAVLLFLLAIFWL